MLQDYLIPGINNATRDFGTFCLAAWIPWKFQRLAAKKEQFTRSRYGRFRESVEIAIAHCIRDNSPSNLALGTPRMRIGVEQNLDFGKSISFDAVGRTEATSLFAAPLYGPSLRYLKLIAGDALADDHSSTGIPLTSSDEETTAVVEAVEASLRSSPSFAPFDQLESPTFTADGLDQLGLYGLNPSYYRRVPANVMRHFLRKFLVSPSGDDQAHYRRLTTRMICETIRQHPFELPNQLRACWYTGLFPSGVSLVLVDDELRQHREKWALFFARQIQRTIAETFLRCFEIALKSGARKLPELIGYWRQNSAGDFQLDAYESLEQFIRDDAAAVSQATEFEALSLAWHQKVHADHPNYDDLAEGEAVGELHRALRMLARWWIRLQHWVRSDRPHEFVNCGGHDRMSMKWFSDWITQRLSASLAGVVEDCFSDIVFSQHIKVALSRFDGQVQRLRFTLGDSGIIPTSAAASKMGQSPVRMADRLESLLSLLTDLDVIDWPEGGFMSVGPNADFAEAASPAV